MRLPLQVISSFVKFCVTRTFWVELRPDVVLEALQVAGSKFLTFYKDDCFTNDGDFELCKRIKKRKTKYRTFQN